MTKVVYNLKLIKIREIFMKNVPEIVEIGSILGRIISRGKWCGGGSEENRDR